METQNPCCKDGWAKVVESSRDIWPAHAKAWNPVPIMLDAFPDGSNDNVYIQLARNDTFDRDEANRASFKVTFKIDGYSVPYLVQCVKPGAPITEARDSYSYTFFVGCPLPSVVSEALNNDKTIEAVLHKTRQSHDGDIWVPPQLFLERDTEYPPIKIWQRLPSRNKSQKPFLTACTMARGDELENVKNWSSYMRLVGVEHVFVYMIEREQNSYDSFFSALGSAQFITLVPWPFQPGGYLQALSQVGAYDNCQWRQKQWTQWTLQAQHDEYVQPLGKYRSLKQLLLTKSDHSAASAFEIGWFNPSEIGLREGAEGLEAGETKRAGPGISEGPPGDLNVFAEESSFRLAVPYGVQVCEDKNSSACKAFRAGNNFQHFFVRPDDLIRTNIHSVAEFVNQSAVSRVLDPFNEARINHFSRHISERYQSEVELNVDCQGGFVINKARATLIKDLSLSAMRICAELLWSHGQLTPEVEACVSKNWQMSETVPRGTRALARRRGGGEQNRFGMHTNVVMHRNVSGDSLSQNGDPITCDSFEFDHWSPF
jgi:hypothetical protein